MVEIDWRIDSPVSVDKSKLANSLELILRRLKLVDTVRLELMITDPKSIIELNKKYRGADAPSDVLSFSSPDNPENLLGSIVINYDRATKQAAEAGYSTDTEMSVLAGHGLLHLLGYHHL